MKLLFNIKLICIDNVFLVLVYDTVDGKNSNDPFGEVS
jgi:hypothetical protein